MTLHAVLFYVIAALTAVSAVAVVVTQNIVRAATWLLFALAGTAGIFFLLTLAAAGSYWGYKREVQKRAQIAAERAAKSAAQSMLADPMLLATGLQIARAIGVKRLLPILAIGGVALGILVSRAGVADEVSAEPAE